ncbi:hypothetical protein Q7C36_009235 [Tachysurus vachellii]|uniref:Uncharacterized protein n=1 Tax=Tachysurus vachellii TaxID=175792 RepID=A0AA88N5R0_TACVA|nr:hypothetical protein Q7C36_009235 [Tachysurus vachellii]
MVHVLIFDVYSGDDRDTRLLWLVICPIPSPITALFYAGGGKVNHPLLLPTPRGCGCFANEELNLASDVPPSRAARSDWLSSSLTSLCPAVDLPLSPRLRGERLNHG